MWARIALAAQRTGAAPSLARAAAGSASAASWSAPLVDRAAAAAAAGVTSSTFHTGGHAGLLALGRPSSLLPAVASTHLGGVAGLASKANKKKKGGGGGRDRDEGATPSPSSSAPPAAAGAGGPPGGAAFDLAATSAAMARALDHLRTELTGLRTGRASPGMLDNLAVPGAYGGDEGSGRASSSSHAPPLRALAATTARDAHTLVVTPFDPATLPALEAALRDGPLALDPSRSPGGELVVPVPPPTKDAAAAMLKVARAAAENARAAVRQARRGGMEAAKAGHAGEDDRRVAEKKVQAATDEATAAVDKLVAAKEKALAEV